MKEKLEDIDRLKRVKLDNEEEVKRRMLEKMEYIESQN